MTILDLKNDFYRPLWIRVALLAIMFGWGAFEFLNGAPLWGVIFAGVGVVALVQWFFSDWARETKVGSGVTGNTGTSSSDTDSTVDKSDDG